MTDAALQQARGILQAVADRPLTPAEAESAALALARELFVIAEVVRDSEEEARRRRLSRLLEDPKGQLFSILLTDRVARDKTFEHALGQLEFLVAELGVPKFMTPLERAELEVGGALGKLAPRAVGKLVARQIRREVRGLVVPLEPAELRAYLERRRRDGVAVNLNQLGEEVLGESRAMQRLEQYVALLGLSEVETISVKLSSIFSQIDLFAWQASSATLTERLRHIYRAAMGVRRGAAQRSPAEAAPAAEPRRRHKLVYLDMEAYRDLRFTVELVTRLLDEPEFLELSAGLVLQAYLPDSAVLQRELNDWARARRARGGAPLRLRIVKGANLAAERVQSSRMRWPLPIYGSKHEVDANYKRMLYVGTEPRNAEAVHLGVASHNLFDLALGLVLRASRNVSAEVGFEVLEGMANSVWRALRLLDAPVLAYAPVVSEHEMDSAVAYLIRRLDENTASENFLRHSFAMRLDDAAYEDQAARFRSAHQAKDSVSDASLRAHDRFASVRDLPRDQPFDNEPDTDFSLAAHRAHVSRAIDALGWRGAFDVFSVIDGKPRPTRSAQHGFDPSRPGIVPYRYHLVGKDLLDLAVNTARAAQGRWAREAPEERRDKVRRVAECLRRRRAELIAAMLLDAGKRVSEADAEVSEAIDFAEYYWRESARLTDDPTIRVRPKGTVLVVSPWNFPLAIPLSGILAALLGGNTVIFKPACETAYVGERLAQIVWAAGVPEDVLQLVLCSDDDGTHLLEHPGVSAVVLTGATSTARFFLERRPSLELHAETGGKNPFIVSALADRELAIKDLLASAFSYAGQKCSAASLAILERDVYDDPAFLSQLRDAAASLAVGSAWDPASVVTPLIRPPGPALERGLTELEPGESWLLEPRRHPENPRLWSPGIKLGVSQGSFTQQTELFGPVLGLMRADDLEHAFTLANSTAYGLTAGLHSLDEREQSRFIERVQAGNLYVNRTTTGAIVGRQPFGGHKASSVGLGAKAGGPNYVAQLVDLEDASTSVAAPRPDRPIPRTSALLDWAARALEPAELERLSSRLAGYAAELERYFHKAHPAPEVLGQDNVLRYVPGGPLLFWLGPGASLLAAASAMGAAVCSGAEWELSHGPALLSSAAAAELAAVCQRQGTRAIVEPPEALAARLAGARYERIRWIAGSGERAPDVVLAAAGARGSAVSTRPVLDHGRYELGFYHREQSISVEYHRYGHLGWRSAGLPRPGSRFNRPPRG